MSNSTRGPARGVKWKPNGIAEQAKVTSYISDVSAKYAAIKSKLDKLDAESKKLMSDLRAELRVEVVDAEDGE